MKKGFTLIELLAVIIILSIVALITVPTIVNIVYNLKENANIQSIKSYAEAVNYKRLEELYNGNIVNNENLTSLNVSAKGNKVSCSVMKFDDGIILDDCKLENSSDTYCLIDGEVLKNEECGYEEVEDILATCYGKKNIIESIKVNYDRCMIYLNTLLNTNYNEEQLEKVCKSEEKISDDSMSFYLKDFVALFVIIDITGNSLVENEFSSILDITYKKGCVSCYDYNYKFTYKINDFFKEVPEEFDMSDLEIEKYMAYSLDMEMAKLGENRLLLLSTYFILGVIENIEIEFGDEVEIINYKCVEDNSFELPVIDDIIIPSKIGDLKVSSIGGMFFPKKSSDGILDLSHLNYLKNIGYYAFANNEITSVKLPKKIETIKTYAFGGNQISGLLDLKKYSRLKEVSGFAENQISAIKLSDSVKTIGNYAFAGNLIDTLDLKNNVIEIGIGAFNDNLLSDSDAFIYKRIDNNDGIDNTVLMSYGGAKRTGITVPNNVEKIYFDAFAGNNIKGELDLSNLSNLKQIYDNAFLSNQITSVKLPNSIISIGSDAFQNNQLSGELDLSNLTNLTAIESYAFFNNQLTSIKIPNSVTTIGSDAFYGNPNLTLIEIDNIKDAISGSPWGSNATVNWLRN